MEYLLRAFKKQRRRLRMENLILLLLRCLIPVILALALARPLFQEGGILPTIGTAHHVMLFDHSYSMGYQPTGSQSPHTKAMRLATARLEQLDEAGQKVSLITAGIRPRWVVKASPSLPTVRARLAQITSPTDSHESLMPALTMVAEMLEDERENPSDQIVAETRIYILTDLQRGCFGEELGLGNLDPTAPVTDPDALLADTARDVLDRIKEHASIVVLDLGSAAGTSLDNVQVTNLRMSRPTAVAGVALGTTVTVRNLSSTTQNPQVTLEKDNGETSTRVVRVEAGADVDVHFNILFRNEGMRHLRATIQTDGLEADNACYHVVDVRKQLQVLLVEGSLEADEPSLMDTGWFRRVLDPTQGRGEANVTEFATKVIDSTMFLLRQENLQDYHMIVLGNVEYLSEETADDLKAAVEAGTGLFVMFGDRSQPESYNLHLYGSGDGPMPIRMQSRGGFDPGGDNSYRSQVVDPEHPVFSDFREMQELLPLLELGLVYSYLESDRTSLTANGKVLWQVSNPQLAPLLIASQYGEGRTLFLTSAITTQPGKWNTLDHNIHSFPLFHPLSYWLTHPAGDPYNVEVGGSLTSIVKSRPQGLAVVKPERAGGTKVPVAQDSRPLRGGLFALPAFTQTDYSGVYSFEMELGVHDTTSAVQIPFAVNPAPGEGELTYSAHAFLKEKLDLQNIHAFLPDEIEETSTAGISELGPFLLYLVLFFILGEAVYARLISRRRS